MKIFTFVSVLALALVAPVCAGAQTLTGAAASLRNDIRQLVQGVKDRVPEDEGRSAIISDLEKATDHLERVRQLAVNNAEKSAMALDFTAATDRYRRGVRRLDENQSRVRSRVLEAEAGFQRLGFAWRDYIPTVYVRTPRYVPVPEVTSRDESARRIATRYLARRFDVSPRDVEVIRFDQRGNRYRVTARVRRVGSYLVDLDAVGGTVFSAEPLR